MGFEPTEARASSVFKTGAFNRSATSPCLKRCFTPKRRTYDTTKNPACQPTGSFFSFFTPFSGDRPAFSQNLKIFSKNFNFPLAFFFDPCYYRQADIRVWRSLVSRLNGVQEALSSNLNTRTIGVSFGILRFFYCSFAAFLARLHESKRRALCPASCHKYDRSPAVSWQGSCFLSFDQAKTFTLSSSPMASLIYDMELPS